MGCAETKPPSTTADLSPQQAPCCRQADAATNGTAVCTAATNCGSSRSSPSPPPHEFLAPSEKAIILADWARLQQHDQVRRQEMGYRIFLRIFELAPSARTTFDAFRDLVDRDQLLHNATFRMHSARFMRVVAGVIDNIDDLDVIVIPNLLQLGRIHRTLASERILREHFDAFERAMSEVWAQELRSRSQDFSDSNGIQHHQQEQHDTVAENGASTDHGKTARNGSRRASSSPCNGLGTTENAGVDCAVSTSGFDSLSENAWMKLFKWITDRVLEGFKGPETNGNHGQHQPNVASPAPDSSALSDRCEADAPAAAVGATDAIATAANIVSKENGTC
jgi:Globin